MPTPYSGALCTRNTGWPVVNSPKGQGAALPPDLVQRPLAGPQPYWTWSVVRRADEVRPAVLAVVDALCEGVDTAALGLRDAGAWLPAGDPHRRR
ncbi:hypothetical protein ACFY2M_40470 [Streptomyces sp. NPDC001276]|uniref:hypothetical protein n=1 Tax=Streptomyces sp. NPDC001276 TaxID=3364555 RepID=UPI0036993DFD